MIAYVCVYIYLKCFCIQTFGKQTKVKFLKYSVVMLEEKNCGSLESLSLVPLTCLSLSHNPHDDFLECSSASILKRCRDAALGAEVLWEPLPVIFAP